MSTAARAPRVIITGASGFLGSRLVALLRSEYEIFAIDRRSQDEAQIAESEDIHWFQIDLCDADAVARTFAEVRDSGGADFVLHLAAYYDFTGENHPEYHRTNVSATRLVLENSRDLGLERFVFASSVAACAFSSPSRPITESTPPLGRHVYAVTKRRGEEMLARFSTEFPTCTIRFAALFSDWCEYPPLYVFLETWLSRKWNARVLGGRGDSAIPYLHVRDAAWFVRATLSRHAQLENGEVLVASPDGAVSHQQLYEAATRYRFGRVPRPIHVPRALSRFGIAARDLLGRALGSRPFERTWMADYIDRRMDIDATRSRSRLDWIPTPRRAILARIPFMIEHMRFESAEWYTRNRSALEHMHVRKNFLVYRLLDRHQERIEQAYSSLLEEGRPDDGLGRYRELASRDRDWAVHMALGSLVQSVRNGEKARFMTYCRDLARVRIEQGFAVQDVVEGLRSLERLCREVIARDPEAADLSGAIQDHLTMTVEFGIDQVLTVFDDVEMGSRD